MWLWLSGALNIVLATLLVLEVRAQVEQAKRRLAEKAMAEPADEPSKAELWNELDTARYEAERFEPLLEEVSNAPVQQGPTTDTRLVVLSADLLKRIAAALARA